MQASLLSTTLQQIHTLSTRAVFAACLLLVCCILAAGLFAKHETPKHYIFLLIVGVVGLASGVLFATSLFVIHNSDLLILWRIGL